MVSPYKISSLLDGFGEYGVAYAYQPGYLLEDKPDKTLKK